MGGSKKRGRGAMVGRVVLRCSEKTHATEIRIKLKSVVSILAPKNTQATQGDTPNFAGMAPSTVSTSARELVLVQLEKRLEPGTALYRSREGVPPQKNLSGRLDRAGFYEWMFHFDIPAESPGKSSLPGGFPGVGTYYPSSYVLESDPIKGKKEEWASVKWYLKLTVERSGLFRSNDRMLVPFIYLPPPPETICPLLLRRQALSAQIQSVIQRTQGTMTLPPNSVEPASKWKTHHVVLRQEALGKPIKRSLVDKMFGSNKQKEERWAISLPGNPISVFALRSVVPFVLTLVHSAGMPLVVHPMVSLVQKVHLRARSNAAHTQYICHAKMQTMPLSKGGLQQWFGWIQFPGWCSPSFDNHLLGLEYFLQIKPLRTPEAHVLQNIPIGLYCAPPKLIQNAAAKASTTSAASDFSSWTSPRSSQVTMPSRLTSDNESVASTGASSSRVSVSMPASPASSRRTSQSALRTSRPVPPIPSDTSPRNDTEATEAGGISTPETAGNDLPAPSSMLQSVATSESLQRPVPPLPTESDTPETTSVSDIASMAGNGADVDTTSETSSAHSRYGQIATQPVDETAMLPPIPDYTPRDGLIHDAGPLTQEQEQAWTIDILANDFSEDEMAAGFDLPPSYFEATGIRDNEEA